MARIKTVRTAAVVLVALGALKYLAILIDAGFDLSQAPFAFLLVFALPFGLVLLLLPRLRRTGLVLMLLIGVPFVAFLVANAARHSGGRHCCLELATGQLLRLVITDDGHGLASPRSEGNGIATMRERARELGGRLTIDAADGEGGRVTAELPTLLGR